MRKKKRMIVAASGYFNPFHVGHLEYLERAKKLADKLGSKLIVIVNNDRQVRVKGSHPFMNEKDRLRIIEALKCVDKAVLSIDKDKTVCRSLAKLKPDIFAKGGDRTSKEIPERTVCDKLGIIITDRLGRKIRDSSEIIKRAKKKRIKII